MPNRRKFITGLGALAAGSAAAVGTGAFTSVEATRSVEVNVTGDANAYLGLKAADHPNGDAYVDDSGDTVAIDITETTNDDDETLGSGLNPNATTVIENLLVVTNQGTQGGVGVWVDIDLGDIGSTDFTVYDQSQGPDADLEQEAVSLDTGNSLTMGVEIEAASPGELEDGEVTINGDTRENVWPQNTGGE